MDISLTVIVPVYNVEKYLAQCLDSIVGQSVLFDEVILINDGSSDNSLSICKEYSSKYKYFKLIDQKNQGLSVARNKGLEYATKEYVMFLDSDDYLRADTVKLLKYELGKFPKDAVYFDADIQCEDGYVDRKNFYDRRLACLDDDLMSGWDFFLKCYPENYVVSACMAVYRREVINDIGLRFPEGLYYEDNYFSFVFIIRAKYVTHISEKLYQRRFRHNSITTSAYSEKKFISCLKIILLIWNEVKNIEALDSLEMKKTLLTFINNHFSWVLDCYQSCLEQNILLESSTSALLYSLMDNYKLLLNKYDLDNKIENLFLFNQITNNIRRVAEYYPNKTNDFELILLRLEERRENIYRILLESLPLRMEKCKVGVYGMGNHTKGVFEIYKKLFGEITCNLIFIDTYKADGVYKGRKIINYRMVDKSFDMVIISSLRYRNEMINNIKSVDNDIFIFDFYQTVKNDLFSEEANK